MSDSRNQSGTLQALREYAGAILGLAILLPLAIIVGLVRRLVLRRI